MKMKPIAMVKPSKGFVYAPSKTRSDIEIDNQEFIEKYADKGKAIPVSFEDDGVSNPVQTTSYSLPVKSGGGKGWRGWFIKE